MRIERLDPRRCASVVLDRIAIDATLGAGVVGADVAALGAEAAGAIAFLSREDGPARDVRQAVGVDAAGGADRTLNQLGLGAEREAHLVLGRDGGELGDERASLLGLGIAPGEAVAASGGGEVAGALAVEVGEGDHDFVHLVLKRRRELRETGPVGLGRRQRRDQDRVVAPDHSTRSPLLPELHHLRDRRLGVDHVGLERAGIAGDRELDHEGRPGRDRPQVREEGLDVPGPEHEARGLRRLERDPVGRAAVGVFHLGKAGPEPGQEPGGVEGRDIRAIARGDDHFPMPGRGIPNAAS